MRPGKVSLWPLLGSRCRGGTGLERHACFLQSSAYSCRRTAGHAAASRDWICEVHNDDPGDLRPAVIVEQLQDARFKLVQH
jgi:hypothetical protein